MSDLRGLLREIVSQRSREDTVALLASAGIDSVSTGIACQEAGKKVCAYTYELQGYRSREREKVEAIAAHFDWRLCVITVPTRNLVADFKRLAIQYGCKKKVHFEVTFPLLYVIPEIEEHEVWTAFNADDHYGNTREPLLDQARLKRDGVDATDRKRLFDDYRRGVYEKFDQPGSDDTWWFAKGVAARHGRELLDPYLDPAIREYFSTFDHDALSPLDKPVVREALAEQLKGLPDSAIAKGVRLQIGGRVDELFRTLLANPEINHFETKCATVPALCQSWGRAVEAYPDQFAAELEALTPQRERTSGCLGSGNIDRT
jgi:asparagine synthetase B (glutamine-hydrolysing)